MQENENLDSSSEEAPISENFWDWMTSYWHNNRDFPEDCEKALKKKADLVDGKVPATQLPSYVDDVVEFDSFENLPIQGKKGKIYVLTNNNDQYRWSGSEYILINPKDYLKASISLEKSNLNTILDPGIYYQTSNAKTASNNYPEDLAGALRVYQTISAGRMQEYTIYNTANTYRRVTSDGTTWNAWKKVLSDADISPNDISDWKASFPTNHSLTKNSSSYTGDLLAVPGGTYSAAVSTTSNNKPFSNVGGLISFGNAVSGMSTRLLGARDNSDNLWFQSGDGTGAWRQIASREYVNSYVNPTIFKNHIWALDDLGNQRIYVSGSSASNDFIIKLATAGGYFNIRNNANTNVFRVNDAGAVLTTSLSLSDSINFPSGSLLLKYNSNDVLRATTNNTILSSANSSSGMIYLRPQGTSVSTGEVTVNSSGQINTTNHGNSSQWYGITGGGYKRVLTLNSLVYSTTGILRVNLTKTDGFTGTLVIKVSGSFHSANVNGLIELKGGLGVNASGIWNNSIKTTVNVGATKNQYFVDEIIKRDASTGECYIEIHKKSATNNQIYVEVEQRTFSTTQLLDSLTYSFDASANVVGSSVVNSGFIEDTNNINSDASKTFGTSKGLSLLPILSGSSNYPSTLGFGVDFSSGMGANSSSYPRDFTLFKDYNAEKWYLGGYNTTTGVRGNWREIWHSGNFDESKYLTSRGYYNTALIAKIDKPISITDWSTPVDGMQSTYGTSFHFKGQNSWYNRLDFPVNAEKLFLYQGINTTSMSLRGYIDLIPAGVTNWRSDNFNPSNYVPQNTVRPTSADFNTYKSQGFHSIGQGLTNSPTGAGSWGNLLVTQSLTDRFMQQYFDQSSNNIYYRNGVGSNTTWGAWNKILTDVNTGWGTGMNNNEVNTTDLFNINDSRIVRYANTASNTPTNEAGNLMVLNRATNIKTRLAFTDTTKDFYFTTGSNDSSWKKVWHSGNFNPANYALDSSVLNNSYSENASLANNPVLKNHKLVPFTTANDGYIYEVNLSTVNTGTITGIKYVIVHDGTTWNAIKIGESAETSNRPSIFIDGGLPKLKTGHNNTYGIAVTVKAYYAGVSGVVDWKRFLGLTFEALQNKPTTLNGYGITDAVSTSSLNSTLSNYATLNGVQTFTNTITFDQNPTIPWATLIEHAVNLGQMNDSMEILSGKIISYVANNYMSTLHSANSITSANITNWNTSFGWGNHATAGYANESTVKESIDDIFREITNPNYTIAVKNKYITIIITEDSPLEKIDWEKFFPGQHIHVINTGATALDLNLQGNTFDKILEKETSEYYINSDTKIIKKGTYTSARFLS